MPNLDNIHYKFFPKSKTAPMGKKLIYFAWAIEILVASVGFTIAMLFFFSKGQSGISAEELSQSLKLDSYIVGLAFLVVTIMELTKIPLATAFYYAGKTFWKILFVIALFAVNYSTFETIIQGFELGYYNRLELVDVEMDKQKNIEKKIEDIKSNKSTISFEIEQLTLEINDLEEQKKTIENQRIDTITNIDEQYSSSNDDVINEAKSQIVSKENRRDELNDEKNILTQEYNNCKLVGRKKCQGTIQDRIDNADRGIGILNSDIRDLEKKIANRISKIDGNTNTLKEREREKANNQIATINNILDQKRKKLQEFSSEDSENNFTLDKSELEEELTEQKAVVLKKAQKNQIYRIALKIKNVINKWKGREKSNMNDVTRADTDLAFALWFGGLALVISIIGTLVALAGLHLQDERMHEIRNKPIKARLGRFFRRIAWIPVYINKLIWAGIKRLTKPKIVKEKVEVEVEKIVEKPVIREKLVYETVEVPKETIRREVVHHPLWTDDPELLSKKKSKPKK